MRCSVCGAEMGSRRLVDEDGNTREMFGLECRNPPCPEYGKVLELSPEELARAEEE